MCVCVQCVGSLPISQCVRTPPPHKENPPKNYIYIYVYIHTYIQPCVVALAVRDPWLGTPMCKPAIHRNMCVVWWAAIDLYIHIYIYFFFVFIRPRSNVQMCDMLS